MGTSTSSGGSPGDSPLVPPWVPPVPPVPPVSAAPPDEVPAEASPDAPPVAVPPSPASPPPGPLSGSDFAPSSRFIGARLRLGQYAKNGSRDDLRSGLKAYTSKGYGGPQRAAARMAGTSRTAGLLHGALEALSRGEALPSEIGLEAASLAGRDAREIGDAIAEAIRPSDGTLDAEAARDAIAQALSDLVDQVPGVELNSLTPEQIDLVIERYVAYDLSRHIELDVGFHIQEKAPDAATAVTRIEDMKEYVRECVAAQFRAARKAGRRLTRSAAAWITHAVMEETFRVFADYLP
jgi:hypothetical protein